MTEALIAMLLLGTVAVGSARIWMNSFFGLKCRIESFEEARRDLNIQFHPETVHWVKTCSNLQTHSLELKHLEELYGEPK
jgi:hypothetical protein